MEVIEIKPRNPSYTSTACVLDVLERQFDIKVPESRIHGSQDEKCYIAKANPGSWKKIEEKLLQNQEGLQEWEFKLVKDESKDKCILINITYSDKKAFRKNTLPTVTDLQSLVQKFIDAADAATPQDKPNLV